MKQLLIVSAMVALCACNTQPPCEATCVGCCDANGECQPGFAEPACGAGAAQCRSCGAGERCVLGLCRFTPTGGGGGGSTGGGGGGGIATGGGSSTGGGGGGSPTGGGGGGGGGIATGGGGGSVVTCGTLNVPGSATRKAFYVLGTNSESTYSVRDWRDANGRNVLALQAEWSLLHGATPQFPVVSSVSNGLTQSWVVMFFYRGCTDDLAVCQKEFTIQEGVITLTAATRAPMGTLTANSTGPLMLQESNSSGVVLPGECLDVPALDWSGTYDCRTDGVSCTQASDCCANMCSSGVCGAPPACRVDGLTCTSASQCCTGQCSSGVCGAPPACKVDGLTCTSASQCCTGQCSNGVCGAPACKADGLTCTSASQCCTGQCSSGLCGAPACRSNGTSCTSASQCCTGLCSSGLCGAPTCRANGTSCTAGSQCCAGACTNGSCGVIADSCNPVTNTGCDSFNDCLLLSSGTTTCALGGFGTQGDSCSATTTCAGGYGCFGGTCRHLCVRSTGQGCTTTGSVCNGVTGWTTYGACT